MTDSGTGKGPGPILTAARHMSGESAPGLNVPSLLDTLSSVKDSNDTAVSNVSASSKQNGDVDKNSVKNVCIGSCGKPIDSLGKHGVTIICYFYDAHMCNKCADMTKGEALKFGERPD